MNEGEIVYISYDAWMLSETKGEEDRLFETTDKAKAEKDGIHEENRKYGPVAVMLGKGQLYKPFESAVSGTAVGAEGEAVVKPADGAGDRDARLVQTFPLNEFLKNEVDPVPGMMVTVKNRTGTVMFRSPGRVVVDFNSPLAGKTLRYRFKVERMASSDDDRVKGIIDMDFGGGEDFEVAVHPKEVVVGLPERCRFDFRWFEGKLRVVADLRKAFDGKDVTFKETFKAEPKPEETKAEGHEHAHEHKPGEAHDHDHEESKGEAAAPEVEHKAKKPRKKAEHKDKEPAEKADKAE